MFFSTLIALLSLAASLSASFAAPASSSLESSLLLPQALQPPSTPQPPQQSHQSDTVAISIDSDILTSLRIPTTLCCSPCQPPESPLPFPPSPSPTPMQMILATQCAHFGRLPWRPALTCAIQSDRFPSPATILSGTISITQNCSMSALLRNDLGRDLRGEYTLTAKNSLLPDPWFDSKWSGVEFRSGAVTLQANSPEFVVNHEANNVETLINASRQFVVEGNELIHKGEDLELRLDIDTLFTSTGFSGARRTAAFSKVVAQFSVLIEYFPNEP